MISAALKAAEESSPNAFGSFHLCWARDCEKFGSSRTRAIHNKASRRFLADKHANYGYNPWDQTKLLTMTAQKVYRNPFLASVIAGLHHGSYKAVDTSDLSGAPVVDTRGITDLHP
ncbi:hypothetical protein PAAG_04002 [Paracoccidioides lutzii Pb01]|uniref:Uncharacterized protein n=1 Tax=Paracoccidioides lutzii (strain ATCC MYA-826 / Pb01) TaxID=502779 RepID=C1GZQ8_PARBA|nr:hypothetical protein PAAG_04002 [Paracoccidioides lutzii Pb01]EEH42081.2 hypothetical protein PAAG_04002 [Paracoccidioides lutzii Pb01]